MNTRKMKTPNAITLTINETIYYLISFVKVCSHLYSIHTIWLSASVYQREREIEIEKQKIKYGIK